MPIRPKFCDSRHKVPLFCESIQPCLGTTNKMRPRDGAIIFGDLIGKLDGLRVSCEKCGRSGRYQVQRLIRDRGRDGKIVDWLDQITADCPKKATVSWNDRCAARCPDLAKVL